MGKPMFSAKEKYATLVMVEVLMMVTLMLILEFHVLTLLQTHIEGLCSLFGSE